MIVPQPWVKPTDSGTHGNVTYHTEPHRGGRNLTWVQPTGKKNPADENHQRDNDLAEILALLLIMNYEL